MSASNSRSRRGGRNRELSGPGSHTKPEGTRDKAAEYRRKRRTIRLGQVLMVLGVVVAVVHMVGHLGAFGNEPSGWQDLAVGYPTAGLLFLGGAIAAGQ